MRCGLGRFRGVEAAGWRSLGWEQVWSRVQPPAAPFFFLAGALGTRGRVVTIICSSSGPRRAASDGELPGLVLPTSLLHEAEAKRNTLCLRPIPRPRFAFRRFRLPTMLRLARQPLSSALPSGFASTSTRKISTAHIPSIRINGARLNASLHETCDAFGSAPSALRYGP